MRWTIGVWFLLLPTLALGQSLGEVAKKERERREKNKEQGKSAIEISEEDLYPDGRPEPAAEDTPAEGASTSTAESAPRPSTAEYTEEELRDGEEGDGDVPSFIPPEAPLEERIETFQRMRRHYENQARKIDEDIAKNERRLDEIEAEIGATSAAGGAGLPVAPQPGTEAVNRQMTGQESQALIAEQNRLQAANQQLAAQKEKLKYDLQQKGRAANLPASYLRF